MEFSVLIVGKEFEDPPWTTFSFKVVDHPPPGKGSGQGPLTVTVAERGEPQTGRLNDHLNSNGSKVPSLMGGGGGSVLGQGGSFTLDDEFGRYSDIFHTKVYVIQPWNRNQVTKRHHLS